MQTNLSLGAFPGKAHLTALQLALNNHPQDPLLGSLSLRHIQICPQNHGPLDEALIDKMRILSPTSQFRLHANVRVDQLSHRNAVLSNSATKLPYFKRMAELHRYMGASDYTLHVGERTDCDLEALPGLLEQLSDLFEGRVGIEAMYPVAGHKYLLDCWAEYQWLLESGMNYALDLST